MFYSCYAELSTEDRIVFIEVLTKHIREFLIKFNIPCDLSRIRFVVYLLSNGRAAEISLMEYFDCINALDEIHPDYMHLKTRITPSFSLQLRRKVFF